jgi:nitrate reductase delta subunit
MNVYKLIGLLLIYPEQEWVETLAEILVAMAADLQHTAAVRTVEPLMTDLAQRPLLDAQERYVATFDQAPGQSLYLLEHTVGAGPDRGQRLADLIEQYRKHGLEMTCAELPDFVPLYLEFLSLLPPSQARRELAPFHMVVETLARRLRETHSPYAAAFDGLMVLMRSRSDVHLHTSVPTMRWLRDRWSLRRAGD